MRAADIVASASRALQARARRSVLSLAGIAVGVGSVVALTSLGEGARGYVEAQFASLGSDVVIVVPGKSETTGIPGISGSPNDLTLGDAEALRRGVPGVVRCAPVSAGTEAVEHQGRSRNVVVMGTTADMAAIRGITPLSGSFLPEGPWERGGPVVVLGSRVASELFPTHGAVGERVRVGGWRLRVIGVLAPRGVHFGVDLNDAVFVPIATAQRMFDQRGLMRVLLQVGAAARVAPAVEKARALLIERHRQDDTTLLTADAVLASLSSIITTLTLALGGIAAISLAVAGIGIMNVMLVAVTERRQEIGLMKAVGAARGQVLVLFLAEALLLATAGAAFGVGTGALAGKILALWLPSMPTSVPGWAVASAFGLALAVGGVSGVLPALRAMRLDPVAALRGR